MSAELFMVFDVESIGLHGEGFAVGWVVVNREGRRFEEGCLACSPELAGGSLESRKWVDENVPPIVPSQCATPRAVRAAFWSAWRKWVDQGAVLVADCAWPVEARFMALAVEDDIGEREWNGPYPLHDLASMLLALGRDPLTPTQRLADELPAHHPLMDARQSARQLVEALGTVRAIYTDVADCLTWFYEHPSADDAMGFQQKRAARLSRQLRALAKD